MFEQKFNTYITKQTKNKCKYYTYNTRRKERKENETSWSGSNGETTFKKKMKKKKGETNLENVLARYQPSRYKSTFIEQGGC